MGTCARCGSKTSGSRWALAAVNIVVILVVPTMLVIIVNFRTAALVIECLQSLEAQVTEPQASVKGVVVVDNDSADGSAQRIDAAIREHGWQSWARLMALDTNGGFGAGNNAAIRTALASADPPELFFLLNPDTVVRPGAMAAMRRFMESNPTVGVAGSRLDNPDGTPQNTARRFPTVLSELEEGMQLGVVSRLLAGRVVAPPTRREAHETDWIPGAGMAIRRQVLDSIGLFDEGYFLYFEEVDFCLRARRAGWPCWYVPDSRLVHLMGQATKISSGLTTPGRRPAYWFESRRRYFLKCHGRLKALLADLARALGHATWRLRRALQRKPDTDPPCFLTDLIRQSVMVKGFRF